MQLFVSTALGFFVGILGCVLFWRYQLWIKPKVEISPYVSVLLGEQKQRIFNFKICNRGRNQVVEITFNAWLCELREVQGGKISWGVKKLDINNSATLSLAPKGTNDRPWGITPERIFATTPDFDLFKQLDDPNRRVLITLRAADALSGTIVVQQKTFSKKDFVVGRFLLGENLEIGGI